MEPDNPTLLSVSQLQVAFADFDEATGSSHWREVVHDVSFKLNKQRTLALVGESGSGKSVSALSILQLFSPGSVKLGGQIAWRGESLLDMPARARALRGQDVGFIFQEPMTSLNPVHMIEKQLNEIQLLHQNINKLQASRRSAELLDWVGIKDPKARLKSYPHQLSGGQRQRVMIAMALANQPELLIADEPTTALDVTIQKQVIELLQKLQKEAKLAILFISHDLNLVRHLADDVVVMYQGRSIECQPSQALFANPLQDYTRELLRSTELEPPKPPPTQTTIMRTEQLKVWFPIKRGLLQRVVDHVKAVEPINLELAAGYTYGIVGESGSGKTTLGMSLIRLIDSEGLITYQGQNINAFDRKQLRPLRRELQVVFQDPYASLSPRMNIAQILAEGLWIHGEQLGMPSQRSQAQAWIDQRILQVLEQVELAPAMLERHPHEFSGGQRQRIAVARAMILEPKLVVLDEPTSALDRTIQRQLVELLLKIQQDTQVTYVFISHDLTVVRAMSHYTYVMQNGVVVERGSTEALFQNPQHAYTQELLQSALFTQQT